MAARIEKERLDMLVVRNGLAPSREKAKALIMSGVVLVNGEREDKPGSMFPADASITIKGKVLPYVSRGGLKLEKAILTFGLNLEGYICFDAGASTGGFTDCMLQNGAVKVYAADVGYGQLDWKLRSDERVVCMEKCNVRYLPPDQIEDLCDLATADVSFISLKKILPALSSLIKKEGEIVALIKPQFEAGREKVGKKGVVKERSTHREVIAGILDFVPELGLSVKGLTFSPVKGPEGNIEYLVWLRKTSDPEAVPQEDFCDIIKRTVDEAHDALDR